MDTSICVDVDLVNYPRDKVAATLKGIIKQAQEAAEDAKATSLNINIKR